ncbi:hypothetical protein CCACVL1_27565 [Corchorus capsularis]|uniref:Uncharacterized protein n=1 Tax=Corchorus capsularis TaxID=210143 RepID=A0A1R3G9W0_COCAP|nr:hypothetical protein CCACVL1_27565 [Corchorus capsularis]
MSDQRNAAASIASTEAIKRSKTL